jgi:hypothetical protein
MLGVEEDAGEGQKKTLGEDRRRRWGRTEDAARGQKMMLGKNRK